MFDRIRIAIFISSILQVLISSESFSEKSEIKELTLKKITDHYSNLRSFEAKITQIKNANYLIRPLESKILLTVTNNEILWNVTNPVKISIIIKDDNIMISDHSRKGTDDIPGSSQFLSKQKRFISILKAIMTVDIEYLEKIFDIELLDLALIMKAKDKKEDFRKIVIFDDSKEALGRFKKKFDGLPAEIKMFRTPILDENI